MKFCYPAPYTETCKFPNIKFFVISGNLVAYQNYELLPINGTQAYQLLGNVISIGLRAQDAQHKVVIRDMRVPLFQPPYNTSELRSLVSTGDVLQMQNLHRYLSQMAYDGVHEISNSSEHSTEDIFTHLIHGHSDIPTGFARFWYSSLRWVFLHLILGPLLGIVFAFILIILCAIGMLYSLFLCCKNVVCSSGKVIVMSALSKRESCRNNNGYTKLRSDENLGTIDASLINRHVDWTSLENDENTLFELK